MTTIIAQGETWATTRARLNSLTLTTSGKFFAADLTDATLTYTTGNASTVVANDYVATSDGAVYRVAASDATDHDTVTAGGVKLYVNTIASVVRPEQFGAVGDGTTDDSAAVEDWLEYIRDNPGAHGRVEGFYLLSSLVTVALSGTEPGEHISISGTGMYSSGFIVNNAVGGINITPGGVGTKQTVQISDLQFKPNLASSGYPLSVTRTEGGLESNSSLIVKNVFFGHKTEAVVDKDFTNGPIFTGQYRPIYDTVFVVQSSASSNKYTAGLDSFGSYKPRFIGFEFRGSATYGVRAGGTVRPEGLMMINCTINGADTGLHIVNTGVWPEIHIALGHMNSVNENIYIDGAKLVTVTGNLLYTQGDEAESVKIVNGFAMNFYDNQHRNNNENPKRYYNLTPRVGGAVSDIYINDKIFYSQMKVTGATRFAPIYVGDGVDNVEIHLPTDPGDNDGAAFPADLVEYHSGATNIHIWQGFNNATINGGITGVSKRDTFLSVSTADNDILVDERKSGLNDAGEIVDFVSLETVARDVSDGTESGDYIVKVMDGGTERDYLRLFGPSTSDQSFAILLFRESGPAYTAKRVKQGAADSGGAGFRTLIVDN